ncbi:hypothetical protein MTO96_004225 [Rhipicephalus appendiculatus]
MSDILRITIASASGSDLRVSLAKFTWHKYTNHGTSITEVLSELPPTPIIAALGTIFSDKCYAACEQELFCEASNFTEAVCIMFLAYYVFNMMYPNSAVTTLEFLQRQLFLINLPKGTKWEGGTAVEDMCERENHEAQPFPTSKCFI